MLETGECLSSPKILYIAGKCHHGGLLRILGGRVRPHLFLIHIMLRGRFDGRRKSQHVLNSSISVRSLAAIFVSLALNSALSVRPQHGWEEFEKFRTMPVFMPSITVQ